MIKPIAVFVTFTAAGMTALAAWDRGGTLLDRLLLVAMAVVIVLAVHLIPALSRRPAAWLVWAGCLLCAVYGHLTFLTHANLRAGDLRASQSTLAAATERQIDQVQASLSHIQARPMATVAAELAASKSWRDRAALKVEIAQGKRAEQLRDELRRLSQVATTALVTEANDPVAARLGVVTGWSESAVTVVIGLTFSILIELVGALLWFEALRLPVTPASRSQQAKEQDITGDITAVTDDITRVTAAITSGECKPTVAAIREFMACSQARAMDLRMEFLRGNA